MEKQFTLFVQLMICMEIRCGVMVFRTGGTTNVCPGCDVPSISEVSNIMIEVERRPL